MSRYLPPSGVPIRLSDILAGLLSAFGDAAHQSFRDDICRYFNVKYCYLVSSGRAGLSMIFRALNRLTPEKDIVLLPAFTSFSVPSAVVNAGLKVALYDLDKQTMSPEPGSLRKAISERTLCIVVCHLFGYPCDMDEVLALANEKGIPVIDDAAQAMGATYRGRQAGTMGEAGLFSLSRGKNISAVDGGIVVTDNMELARELEKLELEPVDIKEGISLTIKTFVLSLLLHPLFYGIPARLPFLNIGASFFEPDFPLKRFNSFQAAIGRRMLQRLKEINEARRAKARLLMERLSGVIRFPEIVTGAEPVFLRLPVIPGTAVTQAIPRMGVVRSYPVALNEIEELKPSLVNSAVYPVSKILANGIVTLPTHQFVTDGDSAKIINAISAADTSG